MRWTYRQSYKYCCLFFYPFIIALHNSSFELRVFLLMGGMVITQRISSFIWESTTCSHCTKNVSDASPDQVFYRQDREYKNGYNGTGKIAPFLPVRPKKRTNCENQWCFETHGSNEKMPIGETAFAALGSSAFSH